MFVFLNQDKHQFENVPEDLFQFSMLRPKFQNLHQECTTVLKMPREDPAYHIEILILLVLLGTSNLKNRQCSPEYLSQQIYQVFFWPDLISRLPF